MKTYTLPVVDCEDNPEEKCLQFSDAFLQENNWQVDDVIKFIPEEDGTVKLVNLTLEKRNESIHRSL